MAKDGFSMSNRVTTEEITGNKTLTQNDCGKVLYITDASSSYTCSLPTIADAEPGWNVKFVALTDPSVRFGVKIAAQSDVMFGGVSMTEISGSDYKSATAEDGVLSGQGANSQKGRYAVNYKRAGQGATTLQFMTGSSRSTRFGGLTNLEGWGWEGSTVTITAGTEQYIVEGHIAFSGSGNGALGGSPSVPNVGGDGSPFDCD